jgi:hypothetical protein
LQRFVTSATLVALLVATAAAFAITERLKLTKSAISGTHVSRAFSPTCSCARGHANVRIVLRRADTLDVDVVDAKRKVVAVLLAGQQFRRGEAKFRWDGRTNIGERVPDGVYRVKIHLRRQHQTIVLPNAIQLDTAPPQVTEAAPSLEAFSPDGDHQADLVRIHYALTKPAHAIVYLGGRRIIGPTYRHPATGNVTWNGRAHGRMLRPGHYTLEVGAVDLAGNATPRDDRVRVRVRLRYIVLASRHLTARAGKRFEVGVSVDAVRYHWTLGKAKGRSGGPVLRLRAPAQKGTYVLTVSESGHVDRARVVVR